MIDQLRKRFEYIFQVENRYEGAPSVEVFEVENEPFYLFGKKVIPIQIQHGLLPIIGYRIENLVYITDAKYIENKELSKIYKVDTLIINALRKKEHPTHLNLEEALNIVKEVKPQRAYFTHISQDMGFYEEVQPTLPKNTFLAYDNLTIEIK